MTTDYQTITINNSNNSRQASVVTILIPDEITRQIQYMIANQYYHSKQRR